MAKKTNCDTKVMGRLIDEYRKIDGGQRTNDVLNAHMNHIFETIIELNQNYGPDQALMAIDAVNEFVMEFTQEHRQHWAGECQMKVHQKKHPKSKT